MSNAGPPSGGPSPLSSSGVPSSFDSTPEFFEESRFQKLWRKLRQEPLIPLGCAATCYALWMATRSIRAGDHHQTNKMFRARIYAQGFTLVALVAGSIFYKDERLKRKAFEMKIEEKKLAEKRDKWLAELEARDLEDREWREKIEKASFEAARETGEEVKGKVDKMVDAASSSTTDKQKNGGSWLFGNKSVLEEVCEDGWGPGMWAAKTRDAWRRF